MSYLYTHNKKLIIIEENLFQKRASFIAKELVMDKVSDILDNTADEDLKDALSANNIGSAGIKEYIKRST